MAEANSVIEMVHAAFDANDHPGDRWLQGSFDGCEPYDEIGAFKGLHDWRTLDPAFLDLHYTALSFFSEAGIRYYIPAFIVADLRHQLQTADPIFHLTHGFTDISTTIDVGGQPFERPSGRSRMINPLRYGAMTSFDYARYRLSVFCREEAAANGIHGCLSLRWVMTLVRNDYAVLSLESARWLKTQQSHEERQR